MRFSLFSFSLGTASLVLGAPAESPEQSLQLNGREVGSDIVLCRPERGRTIMFSKQETGWTFPVAGAACDAQSESCSITEGKTFTSSKSFTIGANIGGGVGSLKEPDVGVGLSFGYSWSESHATGTSITATCPKHHTCQLQATPQMLHVEGYTWEKCHGVEDVTQRKPFTAYLPVTEAGSNRDSEAVVVFKVCTVGAKDSHVYPRCPPSGGEPRPEECDPIGDQRVGKKYNPKCR